MTKRTAMAVTIGCAVLLVGGAACSRDEGMTLRSEAFEDGGSIPARFSCEGDNVSPPLSWTNVPEEAMELALVVADPAAEGGVFHHWVVLGISAAPAQLDAGELPSGAVEARGSSENATWIGPCPPAGEEHDYVFSLYPLSRRLDLPADVALKRALDAIDAARIPDGEAVLEGRLRL